MTGYNGQPVSMPEVDDLRKSQALLLSMLKSLRMPDEVGKGTLTRHQVGKIAAGARMIDTNPRQPVPAELPSFKKQAHTAALVNAFGSNEVRERMDTWQTVVRKIITAAELIQWEEAQPTRERDGQPSPMLTLHQLRPQERATREALADQVAAELGHRTK